MVKFIIQSIGAAMGAAFDAMSSVHCVFGETNGRFRDRLDDFNGKINARLAGIYGEPVPKEADMDFLNGPRKDAAALASDWRNVGNDIRAGIEKYKSEHQQPH